jgi:hypothetical protein
MQRILQSHRTMRLPTTIGMLLVSAAACADPSPALDRVSIWLGGYYANSDVSIRGLTNNGNIDIDTGDVRLENGHEGVGRMRVDFLIWDSQGFTLDYYTLNHSSDQLLATPFSYQGVPFQINTNISGKFGFTAGAGIYRWWFGSGTDVLGLGVGATYYRAKLNLEGTIEIDGASASGSARFDENAVAPVLTFGFKHAFSDELRGYIDATGVKKLGNNLSGHVYTGHIGLEWFPWTNLGVGAEYGATRIRLERSGNTFAANFDIDLDGPSLYLRLRY